MELVPADGMSAAACALLGGDYRGDGTQCLTDVDGNGVDEACAGSCTSFADCADADLDGIRDNPCVWWACTGGGCQAVEITFADMGSPFGGCAPDGTAARMHAISGTSVC